MKHATKTTKRNATTTVERLARTVLRLAGHRRRPAGAFVASLVLDVTGAPVAIDPELRAPGYLLRDGTIQISGRGDVAFALAHELGHRAFQRLAPHLAYPNVSHVAEAAATKKGTS